MENKIISIDTLRKFMNPREMKNVLGGSGNDCPSSCEGPCNGGAGYPNNNYCGRITSTGVCACASAGGE